jgi:hypothetical protein
MKMESNSTPATKQDLIDLETRMVDRLTETMRDLETKLLTAFHRWAPGMEIRVRSHGQSINTLDERLTLVEERIAKLERKQ